MARTVVDPTELGLRLHTLRYSRRVSLKAMAKIAGVPQSTLSRWERAAGAGYPPLERLEPIAAFHGIRVSDLLDPDFDTRVWSKAA